jgi:GT2 family glycosyltransferase
MRLSLMSTSVLIVNFRGYADLERCLESLAAYVTPGDEVIVVDNESDPAQLASVARVHPAVRLIPSAENLGFAAGINLAARHARGTFLLFLNPDTVVEGPVITVLEEWLCGHPDTAVAGPRVLNGDGSTQPSARKFPGFSTLFGGRSTWLTRRYPGNPCSRHNLLGLDATGPLSADWVSGSCLMTRRDVFERLGGLDESFFLYWEDAEYCWRVAKLGFRRAYLPAVPVRHFCGGSARYNVGRAIREFHVSARRLYRKHGGVPARIGAPLSHAGLYVRGELRVRRALAVAARSSGAPVPESGPLVRGARTSATLGFDVSGSR